MQQHNPSNTAVGRQSSTLLQRGISQASAANTSQVALQGQHRLCGSYTVAHAPAVPEAALALQAVQQLTANTADALIRCCSSTSL